MSMRVWEDVLPSHVAIEVRACERDRSILRAHRAGASVKELADHIGVTPGWVRGLIERAEKRMGRKRTAIENYFLSSGFIAELADRDVKKRRKIARLRREIAIAEAEIDALRLA